MNEIIASDIKTKIYTIRGIKVLIDRDLASLYGVETKQLIQQVKRNIERFPERYVFQMTKKEFDIWRSQNVTSNSDNKGLRRPPYCFTEQGSYMVSNVIKNSKAVKTSIAIIDAFTEINHYINSNDMLTKRIITIENRLDYHGNQISELYSKFEAKDIKQEYIFYSGEIYDAYSLLLNIFDKANNEIIIFDNYINNKVLDLINKDIRIIIVRNLNIKDDTLDKYIKQYNNLKIVINSDVHDRFIIIDRKELYNIGLSLKYIGKKCFAINKMDKTNIKVILSYICID